MYNYYHRNKTQHTRHDILARIKKLLLQGSESILSVDSMSGLQNASTQVPKAPVPEAQIQTPSVEVVGWTRYSYEIVSLDKVGQKCSD